METHYDTLRIQAVTEYRARFDARVTRLEKSRCLDRLLNSTISFWLLHHF